MTTEITAGFVLASLRGSTYRKGTPRPSLAAAALSAILNSRLENNGRFSAVDIPSAFLARRTKAQGAGCSLSQAAVYHQGSAIVFNEPFDVGEAEAGSIVFGREEGLEDS